MANSVVLFDSHCDLCSSSVQFIVDRDPHEQFRFSSIHSETGRYLLQRCGLDPDSIDSMVVIEEDRCRCKSDAALEIAKKLGGAWPWTSVLRFIPRRLRDWAYDLIAKNRNRFLKDDETCRLPTPEVRRRLLE